MVVADDVDRLRLRLALLRQRIDRMYLLVTSLPAEVMCEGSSSSSEIGPPILVDEDSRSDWDGEDVLVYHRNGGAEAWAIQNKCPHAMIALQMSDIEDFTVEFPSTRGPCLACPARACRPRT